VLICIDDTAVVVTKLFVVNVKVRLTDMLFRISCQRCWPPFISWRTFGIRRPIVFGRSSSTWTLFSQRYLARNKSMLCMFLGLL